jgi:uncharacterized metal-binding protein
LTKEGFAKMFCLCGVGGHLSGFVRSAKDVPEMVAVDGCDIRCARATLEHAEVPLKSYLVVTELGIEKNKDFDLSRSSIEQVKKAIREAAASATSTIQKSPSPMQGCSCCG